MKYLYIVFFTCLSFQFSQSQIVVIPDANFKTALLTTNCVDTDGNTLPDADADINNDGEIQVSEAEAVIYLSVLYDNISSLTGIESFTNLESIRCSNNDITSLAPLNGLTSLRIIDAPFNQIESFDATSITNLETLKIRLNGLTSLNVDNLLQLTELQCQQNDLTSLDVSTVLNLEYLVCGLNQISELNLNGLYNLEDLRCYYNQLTSLDITETSVNFLQVNDNNLTEIFAKNGVETGIGNSGTISGNPNLTYICADESEINFFLGQVNTYNYNAVVNSYCSFSPGGEVYTIEGKGRQSFDDNICDASDPDVPNVKYEITNGNDTGYLFANTNGDYFLEVNEGTHLVTPILQTPEYYSVSPSSTSINFPVETSPVIADFCFLPNGTNNDLEIVVVPLGDTTPGFIAHYKIIYTNKGNTILSDVINFSYNVNAMSFDSTSSVPDSNSNGLITWDFDNLEPFQTRSITVSFIINTPTETNDVQIGDILKFNAEIQPISIDETPDDNVFSLCVTVTGAVDPNDIICLEGESIPEENIGDYVHYRIRFENIGTGNAVNVVVKDIIDTSKFEISSLVPIDASHNFITRITDTNKVEFIFENIQLPFDDANNDGYIVFKIKTLETLQLDDTFENQADIFFDFAAPIITNNYSTTVQNNLSIEDFESSEFSLYPNPSNNNIIIASNVNLNFIKVIDINGRLIKTVTLNEQQFENIIDVSSLISGIYFIELHSDVNKKTLKFIKQ